jgi:hypothetical protein
MASASAAVAAFSSRMSAQCLKQVLTHAVRSAFAWRRPSGRCSGPRRSAVGLVYKTS